jgi:hypothetical protein
MFRNLDSDSDIEAGHMRNGKMFSEVHLAHLFRDNYGDEGFYSGEEADLTDEERLEPAGTEEGKFEETRRE